MTLLRWGPSGLSSLKGEVDSLFDRILGSAPRKPRGGAHIITPAVDVYETDAALVLTLELPGVKKEKLEVKTEAGVVSIRAEKHIPEQPEEAKQRFHVAERPWGVYERAFSLPDYLDLEKAEADFSDGVLTITVPKREEAQQKEITIQVK